MVILFLSLDRTILENNQIGETMEKFKEYSKYFKNIFVIIPTKKIYLPRKIKNINIIPSYGLYNFFAYLNILRKIYEINNQTKINLIIANDAVLGGLALIIRNFFKLSFKVQINVFGLEILDKDWLKTRLVNYIIKYFQILSLKKADSIRTDNSQDKKNLKQLFLIPDNKIIIVPAVINKNIQKKLINNKCNSTLRKKLLNGGKYLCLSIGRFVKEKDFPNLIKAASIIVKKIPEVNFLIIGDGEEKYQIINLIKKLKLKHNIHLLGSVKHEDLVDYFSVCDLFILPSSHEGLPRVLMMAALSSKPVITTAINGSSDLFINHQSGFIVPIKNEKKLAWAVIKVLENSDLRKKFISKAFNKAVNYLDFDKNIFKLVNNWRSL